jgi:toxin YoeB
MKLVFSSQAWEDYSSWQETDRKTLLRINELIKDILRGGYRGIGKPEPLRQTLAGYWSRRISNEHRIVYKIEGNAVLIAMVRYHYS